jgi:LPS export ABC transporter protein LptC
MNIQLFLIVLGAMMAIIFLAFKPIDVKQPDHTEVAQLELTNFTVYEIDTKGVENALVGTLGKRFTNRYEVEHVTFTDASKPQLEIMHAEHGRYQGDMIYLERSVSFEQEDGMRFESEEAQYDVNASLVTTKGPFTITSKESHMSGEKLAFQTKINRIHAQHINASITLEQP